MTIPTPRLILREFSVEDIDRMHSWQSDPRYLEHYPWDRAAREDTARLIDRFLAWQDERPRWRWQWAIVLGRPGRLIGSSGVRRLAPESPEADVGYELDPDHWGQGYATEAVAAVVRFAFDELGLENLTARAVRTNVRSIRVLGRLGFRHTADIPAGPGKDGREWPARVEYGLRRDRTT